MFRELFREGAGFRLTITITKTKKKSVQFFNSHLD